MRTLAAVVLLLTIGVSGCSKKEERYVPIQMILDADPQAPLRSIWIDRKTGRRVFFEYDGKKPTAYYLD